MQGAGCANGLSARGCAQGRKAYGVHVKPERLSAWPLKERQPRAVKSFVHHLVHYHSDLLSKIYKAAWKCLQRPCYA